jgi:hypothetical protein
MARYLEIASKASEVVDDVMNTIDSLPQDKKEYILSQILYLYNLGIRTAPRATQSTVRLNAIVAAAKNQKATVRMVEKSGTGYRGPYTYKAIQIITNPTTTVEDGSSDPE